ncbi:MAG: hypothetical protein ABIQ35_13060, partial [Verrucomicrobiota bacterium]
MAFASIALLLFHKGPQPDPRPRISSAHLSNASSLSGKAVSPRIARTKIATEKLIPTGDAWSQPISEPPAAEFQKWTAKYQNASASGKTMLEAEGVLLAMDRQKFLANLIRTDPERALQLAVPVASRRDLPESIQELLEKRVSARGELAVLGALAEPGKEAFVTPTFRTATIDSNEFEAFAYGRRLGEPTRQNISLNGIAIGNLMAVSENPVRILEPIEAAEIKAEPEVICAVSGDSVALHQEETSVDVGGEIIFLCHRAHADILNSQIIAAEAGGTSSSGGTQTLISTQGQKRLLLIRVDFPDLVGVPFTDSTGTNLVSGLNGFYSESSYGRA